MNKYDPELGQIYSNRYKEYLCNNLMKAALFAIKEEWNRAMWNIYQEELDNPFENTGNKWRCDTFEVEAYNWNDDIEQLYNFKYKDIEISWYKYLGRGMSQNRKISNDEIAKMLDDCLEALNKIEWDNFEKKFGMGDESYV